MGIIKCPVCNKELIRKDNCYKCNSNHSFDISKKGYTNLLLSNQYHSLNPGDDKEMVLARKEFFKLDKYQCLKVALLRIIKEYHMDNNVVFCDIACGEGYYTNFLHKNLSNSFTIETYGIDISKYAIIEAEKMKKEMKLENINYYIANLSYLPFMESSFSLILNCFAPIDDKEFFRVLKSNGIYIRVLPAEKHLLGLKEILYDDPYLNVAKEENIYGMKLIKEEIVDDLINLETNQDIMNLFKMTPYYYKTNKKFKERLGLVDKLDTQVSFRIRVYKKI